MDMGILTLELRACFGRSRMYLIDLYLWLEMEKIAKYESSAKCFNPDTRQCILNELTMYS